MNKYRAMKVLVVLGIWVVLSLAMWVGFGLPAEVAGLGSLAFLAAGYRLLANISRS